MKYNEKTTVLSKTLIFLFIPIFALLFYPLFFRKRKYFLEHVVVATHFWAFNLILLGVILPLLTIPLIGLFKLLKFLRVYNDDNVVSVFLQICLAAYLFLMLRQSYGARIALYFDCSTDCVVVFNTFDISLSSFDHYQGCLDSFFVSK
jgi:hypothetical protein